MFVMENRLHQAVMHNEHVPRRIASVVDDLAFGEASHSHVREELPPFHVVERVDWQDIPQLPGHVPNGVLLHQAPPFSITHLSISPTNNGNWKGEFHEVTTQCYWQPHHAAGVDADVVDFEGPSRGAYRADEPMSPVVSRHACVAGSDPQRAPRL